MARRQDGGPPPKLTDAERERFRSAWREIAEAVGVGEIDGRSSSSGWRGARCPKHGGDSFGLSDDGGWICRGECDVSGPDAISLVRWVRGCDHPAAVAECRRIVGSSPTPSRPTQREKKPPRLAFATDALPPDLALPRHTFLARWVYDDGDGRPVMIANRMQQADGKKTFRPQFFNGKGWVLGAPDRDRVLFRLPELLADPSKPVLVLEGEKTAEAAAKLPHGFACTTSLGGANAERNSDWSPLEGRAVVVFGDHDKAGTQYAHDVARLAQDVGAASVRVVEIPEAEAAKLPAKWDVADLDLPPDHPKHAEGVTSHDVLRWINKAVPFVAPTPDDEGTTDEESPDFDLREDGLFALFRDSKGGEHRERIADPVRLVKIAANEDGFDSTAIVEVRNRQGVWKTIPLSHGAMAANLSEAWSALADAGFWFSEQKKHRERLAAYLNRKDDAVAQALAVSKVGWHQSGGRWSFLLPDATISNGEEDENVVLTARDSVGAFNVAGTLEDWQREIAEAVGGNSRPMFAVCFAMAGPLLEPCKIQGGGVHLVGPSSRGKTTLLEVAGSVWGGGGSTGRFSRQWRQTANALENVAEGHSDTFLALDEISECDPKSVGASVYMLANGFGKGRQRQNSSAQRTRSWRVLFLSSGEVSPSDLIRAATTAEHRGGQAVRLVALPAVVSETLGAFDRVPGNKQDAEAAGRFADALKHAAATYYGTAGRAFLLALSRRREEFAARARDLRDGFVKQHVAMDASAEARRVGGLFAIAYAAGVIAHDVGVLPWDVGDIEDAVARCFADAMRERGDVHRSTDVEAGLANLRRWFQQRAALHLQDGSTLTPRERHGFWADEKREARIFRPSFEEIVGPAYREVAALMADRGWLERGERRNLAKKVRLSGMPGQHRCFVVTAAFFEDGDETPEEGEP